MCIKNLKKYIYIYGAPLLCFLTKILLYYFIGKEIYEEFRHFIIMVYEAHEMGCP